MEAGLDCVLGHIGIGMCHVKLGDDWRGGRV